MLASEARVKVFPIRLALKSNVAKFTAAWNLCSVHVDTNNIARTLLAPAGALYIWCAVTHLKPHPTFSSEYIHIFTFWSAPTTLVVLVINQSMDPGHAFDVFHVLHGNCDIELRQHSWTTLCVFLGTTVQVQCTPCTAIKMIECQRTYFNRKMKRMSESTSAYQLLWSRIKVSEGSLLSPPFITISTSPWNSDPVIETKSGTSAVPPPSSL